MSDVEIAGVSVTTATANSQINENILANMQDNYFKYAHELPEWRTLVRIAIAGGGPSITDQINILKKFDKVIACGSAHDYLMQQGIRPTYTVVCDPDPLVINYMKNICNECTYMVATQCHPSTFTYLREHGAHVVKWHAAGSDKENTIFGDNQVLVSGGCTVGTRAITLAISLGYMAIDLFGFDTCIREDGKSHAYEFDNPEAESIGEVINIKIDGKPFTMAHYMLGQLFDFKHLLKTFGKDVVFRVHGEGALTALTSTAEVIENG